MAEKEIKITFAGEKLEALSFFLAEQGGKTVEELLKSHLDKSYEKNVPAQVRKFVESKSDWIEQTTREMLNIRQLKEQEPVMAPFMEREMRLRLKMQLQRFIDKWEPVMGVKSAGFTIKKMKTRWGSCNVKSHHLNFNLLLAKVPSECAEYVVVHELTHLLEPSHNARFWSLMEYYLPESKKLRKQLAGFSAQDMI